MTRAAATVLVVALICAGCGGSRATRSRPAATQTKLVDLKSVAQLRSLFNAELGVPRLVVIVSPT
jgi:hypothetical protein